MSNMINLEENTNENDGVESLSYLKNRKLSEYSKTSETVTPTSGTRKRGLTVIFFNSG
jgi:hypothetical protein